MSQQPSVGRMVHYVSHGTPVLEDGSQVYPSVCRAAIVTAPDEHPEDGAPGEVWASLAVLNPTGMFFHETVRLDEGTELPDPSGMCTGLLHTGGTWHWPARVPQQGASGG